MYADLHLHTLFSDGTDTPMDIYRLAHEHNVRVISITDHDTVDGVKALEKESLSLPVEIIPGIEVSTLYNRKLLHILGYYIDIHDERLTRFNNEMAKNKTECTLQNFENAVAKGAFSYKWERVLELNPGQPRVSGIQVVKAMQLDGYTPPDMGIWDMFSKYFMPASEENITYETASRFDAVDIIKTIGGVPVIAHPKSICDDDIVLELLHYGAQGLEVYHPSHTPDDTAKYLEIAQREGVYITGGTDWHGKNNDVRGDMYFAMRGLEHNDYDILNLKGKNFTLK